MSTLSTLKLTAQTKQLKVSAVQQRRDKLARRLHEQIEFARAQANGTHYKPTKLRTVKDADGVRKQVETAKRIKSWLFIGDNGKTALCVRYGSKLLELAKGKFAIEIANDKDIVGTLETVSTAVLAGELDAAIVAAATKLRDGFGK